MIYRDSPEAMYLQIANILRQDIARSVYPPGSAVETHARLAKRFDVSLITIRKAVDILIGEGLLVAQKGKGTFVAQTHIQDGFNRLTGMSTVIAMNKKVAEVTVNKMQYIPTPKHFPQDVRDGLGENCLYVERSHTAGGKVIGLAIIHIPERYSDMFTVVDVAQHSIYSLYENKLHVPLGKGSQVIRADKAPPLVAEMLRVPAKAPVLVIERRSFSKTGELIEFMTIYYAHEHYSFHVEMDLFAD